MPRGPVTSTRVRRGDRRRPVSPDMSLGADPTDPTALEALHPLARASVEIAANRSTALIHEEIYTRRGLLTMLIHAPLTAGPAAIVAGGGALGGLLGPGHGLYHHLGEAWAGRGVRFVRVGYREPNNLDLCAHDLALWRRDGP